MGLGQILIPRNTTIPTSQQDVFTTVTPEQKAVQIEVYQGESFVASDNILLGKFLFENLISEQRGELANFTIQFDIDVNGILQVKAVDRGSKNEVQITVKASHERLSHAEVQSAQLTLPTDDDLALLEERSALTPSLLRETEVMLGRATLLLATHTDNTDLQDAIAAVNVAWQTGDETTLREALDELTDVLYALEDEPEL